MARTRVISPTCLGCAGAKEAPGTVGDTHAVYTGRAGYRQEMFFRLKYNGSSP